MVPTHEAEIFDRTGRGERARKLRVGIAFEGRLLRVVSCKAVPGIVGLEYLRPKHETTRWARRIENGSKRKAPRKWSTLDMTTLQEIGSDGLKEATG